MAETCGPNSCHAKPLKKKTTTLKVWWTQKSVVRVVLIFLKLR